MRDLRKMTELERIAYRRGFDDGLAAMREKIEDLLLENARLHEPILGPAHPPVSDRNCAEDRISGEDLASWLAQPGPPPGLVLIPSDRFGMEVVGSASGRGWS